MRHCSRATSNRTSGWQQSALTYKLIRIACLVAVIQNWSPSAVCSSSVKEHLAFNRYRHLSFVTNGNEFSFSRNQRITWSLCSFTGESCPEKAQYRTTGAGSGSKEIKDSTATDNKPKRRRKRCLKLQWCRSSSTNKEYCKDAIRECVVGPNNHIVLDGPATGQVAYRWGSSASSGTYVNGDVSEDDDLDEADPTVLLLVKPGDEELMQVAADAVRELCQLDDSVQVLLMPGVAARLKHYYGVDAERIHLYEATMAQGYGDQVTPEAVNADEFEWSDPVRSTLLHTSAYGNEEADDEDDLLHGHYTPDLICTLGGDGLLMHAAMMFQGPAPPILSVAGGSLGFLTCFRPEEMVDAIRVALGTVPLDGAKPFFELIPDINVFPPNMPSYQVVSGHNNKQGRQAEDKSNVGTAVTANSPVNRAFGSGERIYLSIRMRLDCRILNREGIVRARYNVLNEVVIDRGNSPYLAALECFVDDAHLTTVQADGVIFATPTGSTAYSMAAGSSVVHPSVPCILVTPICPHVLSFRSMVFPDHVVLSCYVPDDARSDACVSFDGKHRQELRRGYSLVVKMSAYPVPTLNRVDHSSDWLGSLKRNFNFNARPRQKPL